MGLLANLSIDVVKAYDWVVRAILNICEIIAKNDEFWGISREWFIRVLNEKDGEERKELSNVLPREFRHIVEGLHESKGSEIFDNSMKAKTRKKN
ncbi:hypothetical protein QYM36_011266 [Artemia franciscana]|uniref:Uncharacterized protein n=1 Tax=Artemia franciscana TaxID=6661 RepID=A0AA88L4E6_ARTSF|nr:hypothetical protein QYM36_011266 [Artemia franciscana]